MTRPSRRTLLGGIAAAFIAAPAIVRAASLMLVRPWIDEAPGGFLVSDEFLVALVSMTDQLFRDAVVMRRDRAHLQFAARERWQA